MDEIANTILASGRSAVELALFILLPIMIVMLSLMRWLESVGWLSRIVAFCTPLLRPFGLSGLGVFALIQATMVSFAAPVATLAVMAKTGSAPRNIAATLAMVLALAQGNVVFPMAAAGLDVPVTMLISLIGGLLAAACTFYLFGKDLSLEARGPETSSGELVDTESKGLMNVIRRAGSDAWDIAIGALPLLVVALVFINLVKMTGAVEALESLIAPFFAFTGYPIETLVLALTKYVAGGTAMMGIVMEQFQTGVLSAQQVNLLAGTLICTLDIAGVAILVSAGKPVAAVARPAIYGALVGIAFRIGAHSWLYL
jgi:spore maturation protein SpmB